MCGWGCVCASHMQPQGCWYMDHVIPLYCQYEGAMASKYQYLVEPLVGTLCGFVQQTEAPSIRVHFKAVEN